MDIILTPQNRSDTLSLARQGDVLTVNGQAIDFSALAEGSILSQDETGHPLIVEAKREGGKVRVLVILPHGTEPTYAAAYPVPIMDAPEGEIQLPS